jgi:hypothetical protein
MDMLDLVKVVVVIGVWAEASGTVAVILWEMEHQGLAHRAA